MFELSVIMNYLQKVHFLLTIIYLAFIANL